MRRLAIPATMLACLAIAAAPAYANRAVLSEEVLHPSPSIPAPPPDGQVEGACGLAISPGGGTLYVSDYYHRAVDAFSTSTGTPTSGRIALPGSNPVFGTNTLDAVCGLAMAPAGVLYANEWHEGVLRLKPSEAAFDTGESTGLAADAAGNVYVDDRTHVVAYEPSGAPLEVEDPVSHATVPLRLGEGGALGDAYGLAVSPDGSRVYVPDAAAGTVKVFEPALSLTTPQAAIAPPGGFVSLTDAALALDPTNGHLLVVDDAQPGYEHPRAAIDEFGAAPSYAYLGKLACGPVDGGPSGIALDSSGNLYVTDGNSELSNVYEYGPYTTGSVPAPACASGPGGAALKGSSAGPSPAFAALVAAAPVGARHRRGASASEVIQRGQVRVSVDAEIAPRRLPRSGAAPIRFSLAAKIASTDGSIPPQLRRITVEINRNGHLDSAGLPSCTVDAIQPSTTAGALAACRPALIGEGRFSAKVLVPQQAPFPSSGRIVAFNGRWHGHPAILAHVFGPKPVPTSYTLPFLIGAVRHGTYGTTLSASLPRFTSKWGYVTGISMSLGRSFSSHGRRRSYLTAGCPAPKGFPGATFPLSRASLGFAGRKPIAQTLTRSCTAR